MIFYYYDIFHKKNWDFLKSKFEAGQLSHAYLLSGQEGSGKKEFAKKLIEFGIPSGNKSIKNQLNKKIVEYSDKTLCAFMRGIFDGDGSIRQNPEEITLTTGILENARLFQEILLRLGIISSVERSTRSWHCTVRGTTNCLLWVEKIGTNHPEKQDKFLKINLTQQKDRIDILPNYQEFFKKIINKNKGKLGKDVFKYFWNYSRPNVAPSKHKLKELNFGIAEGLTHLEFERLCPDLFNQRKKQWYQFKFPDGESYEMVWDRINVFIEELKKFSGNYLVVAHGMVNKSIIGTLLNLGENLTTISIPHDTIFEIDLNKVLEIKRLTSNGKFQGIELIDYGQKSL